MSAINPPLDLKAEPIDVLMCLISYKDKDQKTAELALTQVLIRYGGYLKVAFKNSIEGRIGYDFPIDTDELLSRLAQRLWEKADKFSAGDISGKALESYFIGWASKIATNIFLKEIKKYASETTRDEVFWDKYASVKDEEKDIYDEQPLSRTVAEDLQEAFELLNENEKEVMRASMDYFSPTTNNFLKMKTDELQKLANRLGITTASIRKNRERALTKIEDFLTKKGHLFK
jgi:RNA polymerase sigma factor (sigma-70 family)